MTHTTDLL